jgi:hypothetical protein
VPSSSRAMQSKNSLFFMDYLALEDEGNMILWKVRNHSSNDRVSHPTRHEPLATPLQDAQISQPLSSFNRTSVTFCHHPHIWSNCNNNSCHCLKYFITVSLKFYFLHPWQNISQHPWLPQSRYPKSVHNSWWWFYLFIFSVLLPLMMIQYVCSQGH